MSEAQFEAVPSEKRRSSAGSGIHVVQEDQVVQEEDAERERFETVLAGFSISSAEFGYTW
jgi:hypothetical protein